MFVCANSFNFSVLFFDYHALRQENMFLQGHPRSKVKVIGIFWMFWDWKCMYTKRALMKTFAHSCHLIFTSFFAKVIGTCMTHVLCTTLPTEWTNYEPFSTKWLCLLVHERKFLYWITKMSKRITKTLWTQIVT